MTDSASRLRFVRKFADAVIAQAFLSAASLAVSLIVLRYGSGAQYGYYVLVITAILLLTTTQSSFIAPAMIQRMTSLEERDRSALIGGLYRGQRRLLLILSLAVVASIAALRLVGLMSDLTLWLMLAAVVAALAAMYREFFRMVLLAYRLPTAVLRGDLVYVVVLVAGTPIATLTPRPAIATVGVLCISALCSGWLLSRALWIHERWDISGAPGILRKIAGVGAWTAAGSTIHWTFSQGYNYLLVMALDVTAVAASASTRLLTTPVNVLSGGVSSLMLPTASAWVLEHGSRATFSRVLLGTLGISGLAAIYLAVAWFARDYIFDALMHAHFAQRDTLLVLWSAVAILMVVRDQILNWLLARGRYRSLTALTFASAVVSLVISYVGMMRIGVVGAPVGVLGGEAVNVSGLLLMSLMELRKSDVE